MNFITRLLQARRNINPNTARERQRFASTMPGQMGAIAASRHGLFV